MYKRRVKIFLAMIGLGLIVLVVRLGHLQLVRGDHYRFLAEKALQSTEVLPARRGQILDRRGRILAVDRPCFEFCLDYRFLVQDERWIDRQIGMIARSHRIAREQARKIYEVMTRNTRDLAVLLARRRGIDLTQRIEGIRSRVEAYRRAVGQPVAEEYEFHPVVGGLTESDAVAARQRMETTVGATLRPSHMRWYPYTLEAPNGETVTPACHIIGVTGTVNASEQQRFNLDEDQADWLTRQRFNYRGWDRIGKTGVERLAERRLRGRRGYRRLKLGQEVLEDSEAEPGENVRLTIDIDLQTALTQQMYRSGETGAIVVLDVETREVLAMVSVPLYDLNTYQQDFSSLVDDELWLPLINRCVAARYPSGSTIKPLVALAALAEGVIDEHTTHFCRGYLHRPGRFRCTGHHGDVEITEAIKRSCNIYFYLVGEALGVPRMLRRFRLLGLEGATGTGLPEEKPAILPTERRIRREEGRGYTPADARFLAIGQGRVGFTPLHMANAIATVAARGTFQSPKILQDGGPKQARLVQPIPLSHANLIRLGMWKVVNEPGGTGHRHFKNSAREALGFDVCGKTGTAETSPQVIDLNENGRIDRPQEVVRSGNMAWFVGFAPYREARIAFAIVVEYTPGHGGSTCGPIAADVVLECKRRGYVP